MRWRYIYFFCFYIMLSNFSFSQENILSNTNIEIPVPKIPEIGELKYKYLTTNISTKDIYILASFYLSQNLYHQAIELYSHFLNNKDELLKDTNSNSRIASAYYNKALSLFSLQLYNSALEDFHNSFYMNDKLYDNLRMIGTIYFQKKDKKNTLKYWKQYLASNITPSPERSKIESAVQLLSNPNFKFEEPKKESAPPQKLWPFLNPDIIPNPDSNYEKKRII